MSDSKIQVKVGIVEFSGEGNQDWLAKQLDKILEKVPELLKIEISAPDTTNKNITSNSPNQANKVLGLSIINIAGKLSCKSGSDLVVASAAYLHYSENKSTFSREDISQTMKKATGYYKDTMGGNLTALLTGLEKNNIFTKSSNLYAIHVDKLTELNAILSK